MSDRDAVEAAIVEAAHRRGAGRSLCPSEVARAMAPEDWRGMMPSVRAAAARLARQGAIAVTQKGAPVDAETARGPIRLGLPTTPGRNS